LKFVETNVNFIVQLNLASYMGQEVVVIGLQTFDYAIQMTMEENLVEA